MALQKKIPANDCVTTKFTKTVTSGVCEEFHDYEWDVKNWQLVQVDENLVKDQQFEIICGTKTCLQSTFTVGLEVSAADANGNRFVGVYCKLKELTGGKAEIPVSFSVSVENRKDSATPYKPAPISKSMKVEETCSHPNAFEFNKADSPDFEKYLVDGSLPIAIQLRVLNPVSVPQAVTSAFTQFQGKSVKKVQTDYAALLGGRSPTRSDLTIVSSDHNKFPCHKLILSARNAKFAKELKGQMSENNPGTLKLNLSGKTVEVLLHYLYTGELLDTWNHPDVIVEFTDAAGEYELTEVLELLDYSLGNGAEQGKESLTSFLLVELANKLNLKNANAALMQRIVQFAMAAETSEELVSLIKNGPCSKSLATPVNATPLKQVPGNVEGEEDDDHLQSFDDQVEEEPDIV